jgi:hypothetical protein
MEFLNGIPLHKYSERCGHRLPLETIRKFVREIASALENAHAKHLVHRDLKPQNVMLVDEGQPSERFVLLDLGMATKTDAARDETIGNPMANSGLTPQYAPPEQFRQKAATHLSDIYSFGTILYHLLTGRLPFPHAGTLGQLWHAVEHDPPPPFSEAAPDRTISADVETIVRQCLEKKPENRPSSMRELRERFLRLLDASPVVSDMPAWTGGGVPTIAVGGDATDPQSHPTHRAADLLTGVRGASGSATMPVSGVTLPESAPGLETTAPATEPVRKRRLWPVAIASLAIVAAVGAAMLVVRPRGPDPEAPPVTFTAPRDAFVASLGERATFQVDYQRTSGLDGPLEFSVVDLPEHVSADVARSSEGVLSITLLAAPGAAPRDSTAQVTARSAGREVKQAVRLRLVWMPPEPFFEPAITPAAGGDAAGHAAVVTSRRTGWNFYERLDRVLPDGTRVPFRLVINDAAGAAARGDFYILENKVSNGIYRAFADANPDLDSKWEAPLGDGDPAPGDERWSRLPVMNVKALDALKFAKWLAGQRGQLPRLEQWRTAAGFHEYDLDAGRFRDEQWEAWKGGPFRGERVAVGAFAGGRRLPIVIGQVDDAVPDLPVDDVSPRHFVRGMAGNGSEWTSDIAPPPERLSLETAPHELVFLTGKSYLAETPLTFADLADPENAAALDCGMADSVTGFRVVLEPE